MTDDTAPQKETPHPKNESSDPKSETLDRPHGAAEKSTAVKGKAKEGQVEEAFRTILDLQVCLPSRVDTAAWRADSSHDTSACMPLVITARQSIAWLSLIHRAAGEAEATCARERRLSSKRATGSRLKNCSPDCKHL